MRGNKVPIIILFIFLGLPVPFSLLSWVGTVLSVANIGMADFSVPGEKAQMLAGLVTMLLAGTYLATYFISLLLTLAKGKVAPLSFLPVAHILLFAVSAAVWNWLEHAYL